MFVVVPSVVVWLVLLVVGDVSKTMKLLNRVRHL